MKDRERWSRETEVEKNNFVEDRNETEGREGTGVAKNNF